MLRLRQIALVASDLEKRTDQICQSLGIRVGYRDPGVGEFGLHNTVMPVGDTFLEIVSPQREGTTAGRYLERRGGDGGYMVILQLDDLDRARERIAELGVRVVWQADHEAIRGTHLHPRDLGGAILSLDEATPPESWQWAGPEWRAAVSTDRVSAIVGAELQGENPSAMARRWGEVLDRVPTPSGDGWTLTLDAAELRFVPLRDQRGEGLRAIDLATHDRVRVETDAGALGQRVRDGCLELCGIEINLVDS